MEEKYEDVYSQEFKEKASKMKIQPIQLELVDLVCKSFKERNKCNINCLYLKFNLCPN